MRQRENTWFGLIGLILRSFRLSARDLDILEGGPKVVI